MLEIRLLGAPEFTFGGAPFRFAALPRALPLLAWLLLHRRGAVQRDAAAFAFWPDVDEEEARTNLRRHAYAIGRALPPANVPWLLSDKRTIAWNADAPYLADFLEIERLAATEATVAQAAAFYRGPFLAGYDEPWIEPERERLQRTIGEALARALASVVDAEPVRASELATDLLRVDPWREDAIRALVTARYRLGDRAGAMQAYRTFAERLREELDVDPMPETVAVYEAVARADTARTFAAASPLPALPARANDLIGRASPLAEIRVLLSATRCATLAGTGGVGKTRLAIETAWAAVDDFSDGVAFANLAAFADGSLVVTAVAAALGIARPSERPELTAVVASLRNKRVLLVLDNCEHVVADVARAVEAILGGCPNVVVLATSREPLAVRGERVYRVPSLEIPPTFERLSLASAGAFGAIALFVQRANAVDPHFALDANNVADVLEICRRVDGIALAIELAAARVTLLEPREIARRLDERFRVLDGGERTALPRQRTMRASIDWSWDLCTDDERALLRRLAIFAGGFTLAAAEATCFAEPLDRAEPVAVLGALVDRSLVVSEASPSGRRYRLLASIRDYAAEKLALAGESAALALRHAAHYVAFGARLDASYETTPDVAWYATALAELDNVRVALETSLAPGGDTLAGAALASAYGPVWSTGTSRGDRGWLTRAYANLDRPSAPALAARLTWQIAAISLDAPQHAGWVVAATRESGDERTGGDALRWATAAHLERGDTAAASAALAEATRYGDDARHPKVRVDLERLRAEVASRCDDAAAAARAYGNAIAGAVAARAVTLEASSRLGLAKLLFATGDAVGAWDAAYVARTALAETFGRTILVADASARLAAYALARDDRASAIRFAREAIAIAIDVDVPARAIGPIEVIAVLAARAGDASRSARFFRFAEAARERRQLPRGEHDVASYATTRDALFATLGPVDLARANDGASAAEASVAIEALGGAGDALE